MKSYIYLYLCKLCLNTRWQIDWDFNVFITFCKAKPALSSSDRP